MVRSSVFALGVLLLSTEVFAAPADDVAFELDEAHVSFDREGRMTQRLHVRMKILTSAGVQRAGAVSARWSPWYEAQPELRAEVRFLDGRVFTLDPRTLDDSPVHEESSEIYSDARRLRAPLPGVAPGAIVDREIVLRETRPFEGGSSGKFVVATSYAIERSRLVIEAPAALPLKWRARGIAIVPKETVASGVRTLVFESGPHAAIEPRETGAPSDVAGEPYIAFSVARSWADLASTYSAIVDRQIAGASLSALGAASSVDEILGAIHERVRYTGIELGDGAMTPRPPAETLARGYGDCKDKSALLVAALRARGFDAHLALVKLGFGEDVIPDLPSLGGFNHAIVYVAPGMWLDATHSLLRSGYVLPILQGRYALIASPGSRGLVKIPELPTSSNVYRETREVSLAALGEAYVTELSHGTGMIDLKLRGEFATQPEKSVRESLQNYARNTYSAQLARFERIGAEKYDRPFMLRLDVERSDLAITEEDRANIRISLRPLFLWLPEILKKPAGTPPRRSDLVIAEPYSAELEYRITPSSGYAIHQLPEPSQQLIGPAKLSFEYSEGALGTVIAKYRFDLAKRRYSPAEVSAFWKAIDDLGVTIPLAFDHVGQRELAAGRVKEGLASFRAIVAAQPQFAYHHSRLASALADVGFGDAARIEARRAVELEPQSAHAWATLGHVLERDALGREDAPGADVPGAIAAYEKVKKLAPEDWDARWRLAELLATVPARLDEAIAEYRAIGTKRWKANAGLLDALFRARRMKELLAQPAETLGWRKDLQIAAAIIVEGKKGGVARVQLVESGRAEVLMSASEALETIRRYPEAVIAAELAMEEPKASYRDDARLRRLRKLRRWEEVPREAYVTCVRSGFDALADALELRALSRERALDVLLSTVDVRSAKEPLRWEQVAVRCSAQGIEFEGVPAELREAALLAGNGDFARAIAVLEKSGSTSAKTYERLARYALFVPNAPADVAVDRAVRAVSTSGSKDAAALRTLAAWYARTNRPGLAFEALRDALKLGGDAPVGAGDFAIVARIADSYELPDVARDLRAKIDPRAADELAKF